MRDQTDHGRTLRAGNGAVDIAVGVHLRVDDAHGEHFLDQLCAEPLLLIRGGAGLARFVGLRVEGYIF